MVEAHHGDVKRISTMIYEETHGGAFSDKKRNASTIVDVQRISALIYLRRKSLGKRMVELRLGKKGI